MSERFESSIRDWYQNSRTANLEFLDLATTKPRLSDLSHNLAVIYDRLLLHSKISIKHFYDTKKVLDNATEETQRQLDLLKHGQEDLQKQLKQLSEDVFRQKPLTKTEVAALVEEIASQPKKVEEEALRLTKRLEEQQQELREILHQIKASLGY